MRFSHYFIERPIFATVISIIIVIVGAIAALSLPAAQYPEVVPPTIVVTASYPGAPPEVIAETVAAPIEQEINGVEGMLYMSSQSTTDGQMQLTVTFELGIDLDEAQVLVQNRVAVAEPRLPEQVRRLGVTTAKTSPDLLMVIFLLAKGERYDELYVSNYALLEVRDALARIEGVGSVNLFGIREYSMRVWLDPEQLAARNLTAGDVVVALREQNIQVASGVIGQPPISGDNAFQVPVSTLGRLLEPEQFGAVVLKTGESGRLTRVRDVARIELGARDYAINSYIDGEPAVGIAIGQLPGSNALATADALKRKMEELSASFPEGIEYRIPYNPTVFVAESIDEVITTLFEAVGLVVIVVLLFLQTWRASIIPLATIPVSLVGTFAAMFAFGFSLNMLSLFGLVLAIGIVVDDAIVVVENVERHIRDGLAPREATHKAMDEVTGAVIAIAFGLTAVFVPTAFLGGIEGQFYRQFALTIAVATLLSALNSLTLSPALCALLLEPHGERRDRFGRLWDRVFGTFFAAFNRRFDRISTRYAGAVGWITRRAAVGLALYAALLGATALGFVSIPTGFIPAQDKGYLIVAVQLPDGASLERTDAVMRRASEIILDVPGIKHAAAFAGFSGASRSSAPNTGAIFVTQSSFDERHAEDRNAGALMADLDDRLSEILEAEIFVIAPPPVQGLGTAGGFKLIVQDRAGNGLPALQEATDELVGAARADDDLAGVFTTFRASTPQLYADIDRVKVEKLGVPLGSVFDTLEVFLGSVYVNDFNAFGRTFQVRAQAEGRFRSQPHDIARLRTRNSDGGMVPLGSVVDLEWRSAPDRIVRYNMFPAAEVNGDAAPGTGLGSAMAAMERLATAALPRGFGFEWTDIAYQARLAGNTALFVFPLCVLFVFLVHAAEFESWSLPLAIILIAPVCIPFALLGTALRGMENSLVTQIGFVVLIGLAAKNAVLIVEFARQQEEEGADRFDAAMNACRLRLRPILMTSFAFILGVFPLVVAEGPGAEMRRALGTAVFTGMAGVTLFGLFLTPVFYVVLRGISPLKKRPASGSDTTETTRGSASLLAIMAVPAALSLATAGCMLAGRDYVPPESAAPDAFSAVARTDEPYRVDAAWWESFGDGMLTELVETAAASNLDLRIAAARIREARALRLERALDLAPRITAESGYTRSRVSEDRLGGSDATAFSIDRDLELFDAGFDASWELDLFGRVRRSVEARTADLQAAEEEYRDVLVSVQAEVARNYFELRGTQARLEVAHLNAANQQSTLDLTIALLEGGRGTDFDVSRARAQLTNTLASIPPLETALARAMHRLGVLTGRPPAALMGELDLAEGLAQLPRLESVGSPRELLRRRPDVRNAERALAAAVARRGVAVADLFPRVTFIGNVGLEASSLGGLGDSGSGTFSFGPRITWAALDLGRVRARIDASDARANAALALYERTVLGALEDAENAFVDFARELLRRDQLRISAQASAHASRLARERYRFGVSDFLTVLDAERTLLEAQDRLVESETRTATALVAVYKALGGGWATEVIDGRGQRRSEHLVRHVYF